MITTVPPNTEPFADPFLREQIFIALANYLASRAAGELDSDAQEASEGERNTVWDGPSAPEATGKQFSENFRFETVDLMRRFHFALLSCTSQLASKW